MDAGLSAGDGRFDPGSGEGRRGRAARGTVINSAFLVGLNLLALIKGVAVAGFISTSDYGVWALLIVAFTTLYGLVQIGVDDKYIQQDEDDQEHAFQLAFTLQLILSGAFAVLMIVAMPLWAATFGNKEILLPGWALALSMPATAFQTPLWTFYRRLDYMRQRRLQIADPVTSMLVTLGLAAAGFGYWSFVIGTLAGAWAGAAVALRASPYRPRLVYEPGSAREYASFSGPLMFQGACASVITLGPTLVTQRVLGTAAVGAIALANNISVYTTRVDAVVTNTLYPVLCSVKEQKDLLLEAFLKSNRMGLLWAAPLGVAIALFAPDLVHFVIGSRWEDAIPVIQAFGLAAAINQIAFNWGAFFKAVGETRPIAVGGGVMAVGVTALALPPIFIWGLEGFALGMLAATIPLVAIRLAYLTRLFDLALMLRNVARGFTPAVVGFGAAGLLRLALGGGERTEAQALAELTVFGIVVLMVTVLLERPLLTEFRSYLRRPAKRVRPAVGA
jgi:O-antigen/teichoic acid export membrane protein